MKNSRSVTIYYGGSLTHHGIPGMKWGVWNEDTKARYTGSRKNRKKTRPTNDPRKMTDEELAARTERLKREVEYRKLESQANPGRAYTNDILQQIGKKVIVTASAGAILYGLQTALGNKFELGALGKAVFNGGAKKNK